MVVLLLTFLTFFYISLTIRISFAKTAPTHTNAPPQASAISYDDKTLPGLTNQTQFNNVAYIDKHPQPSSHPDMPALVKQWYGNLSGTNVAQNLPRGMQSGDVHVAVYDFANEQVLFATGTTDGPAGPYTRLACNSPFIRMDTESLWSEPKPVVVVGGS